MLAANLRKLVWRCFALAILSITLLSFSKDSTKALFVSAPQLKGSGQAPVISITTQEDAPLRVLSTEVLAREPQNFRLRTLVQNQSTKPIRAYAIASEAATSTTQNGYSQFMNLTQRTAIWQPTEIRPIEISDNQDGTILRVRLTIDFIEFSDATTWGPDLNNSRDILAGQREGAKTEKQRFAQLLKTKGREAVASDVQMVDVSKSEAPAGANHSAQWWSGFRSGVSSVRRQVKAAIESNDKDRLGVALNRPFDTSEGAQQ